MAARETNDFPNIDDKTKAALVQAEREFPYAGYESPNFQVKTLGGVSVAEVTADAITRLVGKHSLLFDIIPRHPVAAGIIGGSVAAAATVTDYLKQRRFLHAAEQARSEGIVLSPDDARRLNRYQDTGERPRGIFDTTVLTSVSALLPQLAPLVASNNTVESVQRGRAAHRYERAVKILREGRENPDSKSGLPHK